MESTLQPSELALQAALIKIIDKIGLYPTISDVDPDQNNKFTLITNSTTLTKNNIHIIYGYSFITNHLGLSPLVIRLHMRLDADQFTIRNLWELFPKSVRRNKVITVTTDQYPLYHDPMVEFNIAEETMLQEITEILTNYTKFIEQ